MLQPKSFETSLRRSKTNRSELSASSAPREIAALSSPVGICSLAELNVFGHRRISLIIKNGRNRTNRTSQRMQTTGSVIRLITSLRTKDAARLIRRANLACGETGRATFGSDFTERPSVCISFPSQDDITLGRLVAVNYTPTAVRLNALTIVSSCSEVNSGYIGRLTTSFEAVSVT